MNRRRSWYGWGWPDEAARPADLDRLGELVHSRFGVSPVVLPPPAPSEIALRPPRADAPATLAGICSRTDLDRAGHTYGKAFRDVARAFARRWDHPPDVVAFPVTETEVGAVLDWAASAGLAVVPYGGGSSVVGGVEPDLPDADRPVVTLDLSRLAGVTEVDGTSRAARILGGTFGPDADAALRPHGLTMRHFPQSYEHSTVGGWAATRCGGHFATGPTHIDDLVESLRVVAPSGVVESCRLPGSGAGPAPDRLFLGSEGALGIITSVWLRVQDRPRFRAAASVRFASMDEAVNATRAVAQSGMQPAGCRLLDPMEALSAGVTDGSAVLLLAFESADHPVEAQLARAVEQVVEFGGSVGAGGRSGDSGGWRASFLRAPYLRDAMISLGCIAETFETACTWQAWPALDAAVREAVGEAMRRVCGVGQLGLRFTHVYPDGPAAYYTVLAAGRPGDPMSLVAQWDEIKAAASAAIIAAGGTITHHHAVGRVHRPWYDQQRPDLFAEALGGAKRALDPQSVMNPGVLL